MANPKKKKTAKPATSTAKTPTRAAKPARTVKITTSGSVKERLSSVQPSGAKDGSFRKDDSFFGLVHEVARQIPRGRVTSYGAIAACLGTRLSARMVGWAMMQSPAARKPVPAHRVVNSIGLLSGRHHFHPPERMQQLLEKEGVTIKNEKVVDFKNLFWDPAKEL